MAADDGAQGEHLESLPSHAALEAALLGEDVAAVLEALNKWSVWQDSPAAAPGSQNLDEAPLSAPALHKLFALLASCCTDEKWSHAYVCSASLLHLVGRSWNAEEAITISKELHAALRAALASFTAVDRARSHTSLRQNEASDQVMLALVLNNFCGSIMRFLEIQQSLPESSEQGVAAQLVDRLLSVSSCSGEDQDCFSLLFAAAVSPGREACEMDLQKHTSLESDDQRRISATLRFARMQASRAVAELVACALQESSPNVREARESSLLTSTISSDLIKALLYASPDLRLHQLLVELLWRGLRRLSPANCKPSQDSSRSRSRSRSRHKQPSAVQQLEEGAGAGTCSFLQSLTAKDMLEGRTQVAMQISRRSSEVLGPYRSSCQWGGFSREQCMVTFTAHSLTIEVDGETPLELPWACIELPDLLLPEEDQPLSFVLNEPSWPVLLTVDIQAAGLVSALPTWVASAVGSQNSPLELSALDKPAADLFPRLRKLLSGSLSDEVSALEPAEIQHEHDDKTTSSPAQLATQASASEPAESQQERGNEQREATSGPAHVSAEAPTTPSNCNSFASQPANSISPSSPGVRLSDDAERIAGEAASLGIMDPEQLRQLCRQQGVSDYGLRHDLISRLLLQRLMPSTPGTPRTGSTVMTPSFAPFSSVRKSELRAACGDRGLAETGTSNDLVYRLTAAASKPVKCEKAPRGRSKASLHTVDPQESEPAGQTGLPLPTNDSGHEPQAIAEEPPASLDANAQAAAARALQQFENMHKKTLSKECTARGLSNTKKKCKLDLVSFLVKHTRLTSEAKSVPPLISSSAQELHDANIEELGTRNLKELRAECKEQGLLQHGGREAVKNRLAAWRRSGSADRSRSILRQAGAKASKCLSVDSSMSNDELQQQSEASGISRMISTTTQKITSFFKKQLQETPAIGEVAETLPPTSLPTPPSHLRDALTIDQANEALPPATPPTRPSGPQDSLAIGRAAEALPPTPPPTPASNPVNKYCGSPQSSFAASPAFRRIRAKSPEPPPTPASDAFINCSSPQSSFTESPALRRLRTKSPDPRALDQSPAVQSPASKVQRRIRGKSPDPRGHQAGLPSPSQAPPTSPARTAAVNALLSLRVGQLEDECRRRGLSPRSSKHAMACRLAAASLRQLGSPGARSDGTELLSPSPHAPSSRSKSSPPTSPAAKKAAGSPHQAQAKTQSPAAKGDNMSPPQLLRRRRSSSCLSPPRHSSRASAGSGRKKHPGKWTAEEDAVLLAAGKAGVTWERITDRLPGRSASACRLHFRHLGGHAAASSSIMAAPKAKLNKSAPQGQSPSSPGMMRSSTPQRVPIPQEVASLLCRRPGASPVRNKEVLSPPSTPPSRSRTRPGERHTSDKAAPARQAPSKRSRGRSLSLSRSPSRPRLSTCNATTKGLLPCRASGISRPVGAMFYYCARHASEWLRHERRGEDVA